MLGTSGVCSVSRESLCLTYEFFHTCVGSPPMRCRLAAAVAKLAASGQTIAVAETSAGGLISAKLLAQPGASKFYLGGVVTYTEASKTDLIGVDASKSRPTATEPHAYELAAAVRAKLGSDWAIGETGVAGPAPNSRGIAPGVCAIAVLGPGKRRLTKSLWPDDQLNASDAYGQAPKLPREERMQHFSAAAIDLLCDAIAVEHGDL